LPTIDELKKVVTDCRGELTTDTDAKWDKNVINFSYQSCYKEKGFTSSGYWSSTPSTGTITFALHVNFNYGYMGPDRMWNYNYVCCVRDLSI